MKGRIAEKNLERRAKRCVRPRAAGEAECDLAVELLQFAAIVVAELLGPGAGQHPVMTCAIAVDAVDSGWMTPCQALRFAHEAISRAVE